jgi:hypothetical protein
MSTFTALAWTLPQSASWDKPPDAAAGIRFHPLIHSTTLAPHIIPAWGLRSLAPPAALRALQDVEHFHARSGIEIAGRFVGEDNDRVGDQRPGNGDALLLSAGELVRAMIFAVSQTYQRQKFIHFWGVFLNALSVYQQWQGDIFGGGQGGEQIEELEDESDLTAADDG